MKFCRIMPTKSSCASTMGLILALRMQANTAVPVTFRDAGSDYCTDAQTEQKVHRTLPASLHHEALRGGRIHRGDGVLRGLTRVTGSVEAVSRRREVTLMVSCHQHDGCLCSQHLKLIHKHIPHRLLTSACNMTQCQHAEGTGASMQHVKSKTKNAIQAILFDEN